MEHFHQKSKKTRKKSIIVSDIALYSFQIAGTDLFYWNGENCFSGGLS